MIVKKANKILFYLCCSAVFVLLITVSSLTADETEKLSGMKFAQLAWGGILYDDWPLELGIKINETHPSYPAKGMQEGATTWRCKECHGWDYKGKAGASLDFCSVEGSRYTGIGGIRSYANVSTEEIIKALKDNTHAFGDKLPEIALVPLALFVSYGQIDMDLYVGRNSKKTIGDPTNGGRIYLTTCIKCHGSDGKGINFRDEKKPMYIGTAAKENPWETLHKIRWGHPGPGTQMIPLLFLSLKEQIDVLSFCQTLPDK